MKTNLIFALIAILLFSCCVEYHNSELKTENGTVIAKQFRGEIRGSEPTVGFTTGGEMTFGVVDIHVSEKFDVVFKCEHGVIFTINDPEIYSKIKEQDTVLIEYYEILNESNEIVDFDFLDANKK